MRFSDIVDHLGNRGFATRESYGSRAYVVFGLDNIPWMVMTPEEGPGFSTWPKQIWTPCLAEIKADDWQILDMYWECPRDDFKPFEK
jgi:hypothetical protein